jgi:CubicO group peptidase (beta-lactamase class C family)
MKLTVSLPAMLALLTVVSGGASGPPRPQTPSVPSAAARAARVEQGLLPGITISGRPLPGRALAARMADLKVPGVSIAVINGGAIEWARGYGVAETGSATPVTPRTLFQAASVSKPVAALGALRLVERGQLSLDQDVNERLTSWKVAENEFTKQEKVTLRRLLSHSAGLTVHGFPGYAADAPVPSLIQVLDGMKPANTAAIRADVLPGSVWRYSGGGFTVVQQLLVDVTGRPFPALLKDLVLVPVGMADSTYDQPLPESRRAAAASGHRADGSLLPGRSHTYPELAAAGLWTTPTDLARFLIEIQKALEGRSKVITADTARQMITIQKGSYGLGLSLEGAGAAVSFGHGGANAGFRCAMTAFVAGGRGAVVMTNGDQGGRLGTELLPRPRQKTVVAVDAAVLAPLAGRYELRPGRILTVAPEGATLFVIDGPQRIELFPESATKFFELVEEHDIEFVKGPDGAVTHILIDGQAVAKRLGS